MVRTNSPKVVSAQAVLAAALRLPNAEAGVACAGTVLEAATVKVQGKAFLFVGKKGVRFKLAASIGAFAALCKKEPDRYSAGAGGWVAIELDPNGNVPAITTSTWLPESHALFANPASAPRKRRKIPGR